MHLFWNNPGERHQIILRWLFHYLTTHPGCQVQAELWSWSSFGENLLKSFSRLLLFIQNTYKRAYQSLFIPNHHICHSSHPSFPMPRSPCVPAPTLPWPLCSTPDQRFPDSSNLQKFTHTPSSDLNYFIQSSKYAPKTQLGIHSWSI